MDSTWSVRVPDELKEKLQRLLEDSGISSKEFMSNAIQTLELQLVGNINHAFQPDIDELHQLTARINAIYMNSYERFKNSERAKELEFEGKIEEKNKAFLIINNRINELEQNIENIKAENAQLKQANVELKKQNTQLTEITETNKELISELKEKNDTLTGLLGEYKAYKNNADELQKTISSEKQLHANTETKLKDSLQEIEQFKARLEDIKQAHTHDLIRERELLTIEKEKELLKIRHEFQLKSEAAQEEYSNKVKELLKVIQDMQQKSAVSVTSVKKKSVQSKIEGSENEFIGT